METSKSVESLKLAAAEPLSRHNGEVVQPPVAILVARQIEGMLMVVRERLTIRRLAAENRRPLAPVRRTKDPLKVASRDFSEVDRFYHSRQNGAVKSIPSHMIATGRPSGGAEPLSLIHISEPT